MLEFYKGKKVLITGHTGFKGTWLCKILLNLGAEVTGYSLATTQIHSLLNLTDTDSNMLSIIGDIRDYNQLLNVIRKTKPEIVFHLAAQPIVREGYKDPRYTYETNVMGTVNILDCIRLVPEVKSVLNVTTDKVYENREWVWGYRETDVLNGYDPYSNSKSCSELVTNSYKNSFLSDANIAISTARAGNVIGGGDFAKDRIIPDCIRAATEGKDIIVRNPHSIRPYQHVLEALYAYLLIASKQFEDINFEGNYNVGPNEQDYCCTETLVDIFIEKWGKNIKKIIQCDNGPYESNVLRLDCSKLKNNLGWKPIWNVTMAIEKTVEWSKCWQNGGNIDICMNEQIWDYIGRAYQNADN